MEGGWLHNGHCTVRIQLTWLQTEAVSLLQVNGQWHAKVQIIVRFNKFFETFRYISHSPMEMETVPHSPGVTSDLSQLKALAERNDFQDGVLNKRKACSSPEMDRSPQRPAEKKIRPNFGNENSAGRGSFTRDDRFIYGNPKEVIKPSTPAADNFDSSSVLDLSCKGTRPEEHKPQTSDNTYQHFPRNNHPYLPDPFPRSNLEIKLVNAPKRPSTSEQLEIAKLQQQQRRSVQQQQKILQQMRRSLDAGTSRGQPQGDHMKKPLAAPQREEIPEAPKSDFRSMLTPSYPPHPYFDPNQNKELPDGHPILPLLDPVYFSALYNAHGFLPPSSPSIAAAFIGTLQDALPKLSMMFPPSTSSCSSPLPAQRGSENPN